MKKSIFIFMVSILMYPLTAQNNNYRLLVGTYTNTGKSQGIYSYDVDMQKSLFTQKSVTTGVTNPSFLAITPDRKFVYSVCESTYGGAANAFTFNEKTAKLTFLNTSLTKSNGPCYITVTKNHMFTANYGGGSVSVFGRNADGSLTEALQIIQHVGNSINALRQNVSHVHQIIVSPDNRYMLVNDLGTDKVTVYKYNPTAKADILMTYDTLTAKLGSGPRHSTFNKAGNRLYLLQEIDGTVTVLDMNKGKLKLIQETTVVKNDKTVGAADIHLSPDERFLYATNRGNANDIACFSVDKDGKLTFKQQLSTGGNGPRNFAITPDGQYLFVGHQLTNNIVIFKRNIETGLLTNTGKSIEVGAPVCLLFY